MTAALPAERLEKVSGDDAVCPTQTTTCTFVVRAVDVNGVPVPGASVSWSSPNTCGAPIVATTDGFGLATVANLCATAAAGTYTQTATLVSNQQQASFVYTVRGLAVVFPSVDVGVRTDDVTSGTTQASGLSVAAKYRSGPVANYGQVVTLNRTVTPAAPTLAFDESQLPFGNYVPDITVSTTTPGIGTGVETIVFTPVPSGFSTSNAPRRQDLRRASVALRAP